MSSKKGRKRARRPLYSALLPEDDPIQRAIDWQRRSLAGMYGLPFSDNPSPGPESVIIRAIDEKYTDPGRDDMLYRCYLAGYTIDEIAQIFQIPPTQAKFRIKRAYLLRRL